MEIEEKEFYHKQALDAKRKNKLLKVAISRLQVDREKKKEDDALMIEQNKGEREKDTDTFLTGANIDEKEVNVESIENSQALVEQNLLNNQSFSRRRGVNQSFQLQKSTS